VAVSPTPYPELNGVLEQLVDGIRRALRDSFIGAYLQGSFAVGDFDQHSDADFVVAVREELSTEQIARLGKVHRDIYNLPAGWAKHLEGSYFPLEILRRGERSGAPLWYLDHGSSILVRSSHCNTLVVRSVLRERGITLDGPPASELVDPISIPALREEIARTMDEWAREILNEPGPYRNRFYQGYIVLSYARMLHDLTAGRPGSKRGGAEWAKATFDASWHDLIDQAWETRPEPATSVRQPADTASFDRSLAFMKMCVRASTATSESRGAP
jgi:predicted nucleotidyltransferase